MAIINFILDLIYPRKCIVCGSVLDMCNKNQNCSECKKCLQYFDDKSENEFFNRNNKCITKNYGVFAYNEYMRDIIHKYKYSNKPAMGQNLAELMDDKFREIIKTKNVAVVIPVPLHKKRYRSRGYNQSEILAKKLSKKYNIKIDCKSLSRVRFTKPQNNLSVKMRENNLKKAFDVVDKECVRYKSVLLIDDIYTTGSTVEACAEVLLAHGVSEVYSLCLAVAGKTIKK